MTNGKNGQNTIRKKNKKENWKTRLIIGLCVIIITKDTLGRFSRNNTSIKSTAYTFQNMIASANTTNPVTRSPYAIAVDLEIVKQRIERLGVNYQIEILSILVKDGVHINENKTGIRLNLGILWTNHKTAFDQMIQYLEYAEEKETRLDSVEHVKQEMCNTYFSY